MVHSDPHAHISPVMSLHLAGTHAHPHTQHLSSLAFSLGRTHPPPPPPPLSTSLSLSLSFHQPSLTTTRSSCPRVRVQWNQSRITSIRARIKTSVGACRCSMNRGGGVGDQAHRHHLRFAPRRSPPPCRRPKTPGGASHSSWPTALRGPSSASSWGRCTRARHPSCGRDGAPPPSSNPAGSPS